MSWFLELYNEKQGAKPSAHRLLVDGWPHAAAIWRQNVTLINDAIISVDPVVLVGRVGGDPLDSTSDVPDDAVGQLPAAAAPYLVQLVEDCDNVVRSQPAGHQQRVTGAIGGRDEILRARLLLIVVQLAALS